MNATPPSVSVIIAAYDAAATLAETLACLQAQTVPRWEAVIVDDGSTDDTAAIAEEWARRDPRFRLLRQANAGASAARNTGIREARHDWLVFLDSDDMIADAHVERMTEKAAATPELDVVVCGCDRVSSSGELVDRAVYPPDAFVDPFPAFALDCPVNLHNCMVRRLLVTLIGGFDPTLAMCVDWDLWQRVARAGARFGTIPDVLAFYRTRPGSLSSDGVRALQCGWTVLRRAHGPDSRVGTPAPRWSRGLPIEGLPVALFRQAIWAACLLLVQGKDPAVLYPEMGEVRAPALDPDEVACWIHQYVPIAAGLPREAWSEQWPRLAASLERYLVGLEAQAGAPGLAARALARLRLLVGVRRGLGDWLRRGWWRG